MVIKVLYVDDEDMLHEPVKLLLETEGKIHVDVASSAAEALKEIQSTVYDAVISDYQMPEMDGLEFLERIRKMNVTVPFILFTGKGREEVAIDALNRGANYYFRKGGDLAAQMAEIREIVRESNAERMLKEELRETREVLESLVQNTDDAVILFDTSGRILKVNSSFERIYGWTPEQATGMKLPMVPTEELGEVEARFRAVAETGMSERYQSKRLRRDGSWFYGSMTISPVRDANGRIVYISGIGRDVTRYVKAMDESSGQRELFQTALSSIGDGVVTTDVAGNILFLNPVAQDVLDCSLNEVCGRPLANIFSLFNGRTLDPVDSPVKTVLQSRASARIASQTILISRSGKAHAVSGTAAPIMDRNGGITGSILVFRDVTSRSVEESMKMVRIAVRGILASSKTLKEVMLPLLEVMCSGLGFAAGEFWIPEEDAGRILLEEQWASGDINGKEFLKSSRNISVSARQGVAGMARNGALSVLIADIQSDEGSMHEREAQDAGLKTAIAFPVMTGERIAGIMVFYRRFQTESDGELKELMADLGGEIGRFYTELMSDQRLRTAMEMIATYMQNSLDAIAITDREGRTLNVNPAFERLYGWKFEEIRGRPLPTVPPASEMDYRRNVEGALNGNSKRFDAVRIRKDGSPVEVSISLFPLLNETGGIYAVASSTRDMTESKMLRNVLLLHDAVLRNSPYMFLILDSDSASGNRVEFANSSFLEMAGATEADATGKAFNLVLEKLVSRSELGAVLDSISRHNRYSGDLQLKRPAGPSIWVHLDVSPVKGEDGRLSHWVCGMKDATEVITSRAQLREANEKFKLVANLDRHDIRNCLHSILTFAEVGILSDHDEGTTRSFRGIRDAARRISDHIDQFRNIQDSIDGEGAQWQDLADVVSRALSGFDLKDIDLITNVGETEIHSTPFLEKVFHNLIDNSMRHGSHVTRISISAVSDGAVHKIVYGDDGIGIQDDAKKSLFSGRLADRSMHGLGLVSGLLESCGMSICESGEYGKGARFEITVPAVSFRNPKVQHVAEV